MDYTAEELALSANALVALMGGLTEQPGWTGRDVLSCIAVACGLDSGFTLSLRRSGGAGERAYIRTLAVLGRTIMQFWPNDWGRKHGIHDYTSQQWLAVVVHTVSS